MSRRKAGLPASKKPPARRERAVEPAAQGDDASLALVPGLRDRLVAEFERAGLPPRRRVSELSRITSRKTPTVRRWVDSAEPGLPDLESFVRLCRQLDVGAEYLLGLSPERKEPPQDSGQAGAWLGAIRHAAGRWPEGCEPLVMAGDDMEPRIRDGDVLFVDRRVTALSGNGTYVVQYMGRTMVRMVEDRLAEGWALRCANPLYSDIIVSPTALASGKLSLLGKVVRRLAVEPV